MQRSQLFKSAFRATSTVMLGYLVTGFAMGLLAQQSGYPWWVTLIMCLLLYAGSMQFLAIELFVGGTNYLNIALLTLFLNARHMVYGLSLLNRYQTEWKCKPYMIHSLTDETYALYHQTEPPDGISRGSFDLCATAMDHSYWTVGCTLGAVAGQFLPFDLNGLDFALTALFIVIAVDQWTGAATHIPAFIGLACALVSLILLGAQNFLLPAMLAIIILLFACKKPISQKNVEKREAEQSAQKEEQSSCR